MKLSRRIVFSSAVQNGLLLSVLLAWTLLLLPAALTLAQETTPEAPVTVTVTEAPPAATVEAPLATVEPAATLPATDLPPAATAEATTGTDLPAATAEATAAPPFTGFSADFSAWTGAGWQVVGWQSAADADGNAFLTAALPGMVASPEGLSLADFQLEARLKADAGSTLEIVLRAGEQSDRLMFSALGAVRLYRGETLLAASAAPALSTPDWFNVTIIAAGERLGVSINAVPHLAYTGAAPLPAGPVQFVSGAENTGSVALDDVVLLPVDAATVILPTPALPTDAPATEIIVSPAAPLTPPAEATAEATAAATAEPETTPEPEATAEAEMTALPETTPAAETTPEADAAATAEADPAALSAADLARIAPQFLPIVESQLRGDAAALAAALQAGGVLVDDQGRILMQVYYAPGYDIAGAVAAVNGEVLLALATSAEMFISPASLPALLQNPDILWLTLPPLATSTGPIATGSTGPNRLRSFDVLGIEDWHSAGQLLNPTTALQVRGTGVSIGIIDTGFGLGTPTVAPTTPPAISGDYACLKSPSAVRSGVNANNNNHGRSVIEVVCDMAPAAQVSLYQAATYGQLRAAVQKAREDNMRIILITLDLGAHTSPGDGTGNEGTLEADPYEQIALARQEGRVVITAAGNNNGRYVTFEHNGASRTINIEVTNLPTERGTINVSWSADNWSSPALRPTINVVGLGLTNPGAGPAGHQFSPTACVPSQNRDSVPGNETCQIQIQFSSFFGGGSGTVYIQMQVTGSTARIVDDLDNAIEVEEAGNLGRPADSASVFTVGAVCASFVDNFPILPNSSKGPIFSANGLPPAALPAVLNRERTKPDLVSMSQVVTSFAPLANDCNEGFGGTSAAAAHVAGMVALLKANTTNASMAIFNDENPDGVRAILDYLQARAVEQPFGNVDNPATPNVIERANGFDMTYGAGIAVLGSPYYDLSNTINYDFQPDSATPFCPANRIFVGQGNPGATTLDGSLNNPYLHIAQALGQVTLADTCVVVMPGEYTTSLHINGIFSADGGDTGTEGTLLASYDSLSAAEARPSIFWLNNQYFSRDDNGSGGFISDLYGSAQILIRNDAPGFTVNGFRFIQTRTYEGNDGIGTVEPRAILIHNTPAAILRNNTFGQTTIGPVTYRGWNSVTAIPVQVTTTGSPATPSHGARIENNTFINNEGLGNALATSIYVVNSGTNANRVRLAFNEIRGNRNTSSGAALNEWYGILYADNSAVDIMNNRIVGNTGETIIKVQTTAPGNPGSDFDIRILGNVILSNIMDSTDGTVINPAFAGPLINAIYAPRIYVLNNTIIKNRTLDPVTSPGNYGGVVVRGDPFPGGGSQFGSITNDLFQSFAIHNNIIAENIIPAGLAHDSLYIDGGPSFSNYQCDDVVLGSGANNQGAQHNWVVFNNTTPGLNRINAGSRDGGVCNGSLVNVSNVPQNDNLFLSTNYATAFLGYQLNTDTDPANNLNADSDPLYYQLRVVDVVTQIYSRVVDFGQEGLAPSIYDPIPDSPPSAPIDALDFELDATGRNPRIFDIPGWPVLNPPRKPADATGTETLGGVDIGAYEFNPLRLLNDDPAIPLVFVEDATPIQFDLFTVGQPEGGFGTLRFEIDPNGGFPAVYGTHCLGANFNDENKGTVISGSLLLYCPPLNYYTDDGSNSPTTPGSGRANYNNLWQDELEFKYRVFDSAGANDSGRVRIEITPTNDTDMNTTPGYNYSVTSDGLTLVTTGLPGSDRATVDIQLRPFVLFEGDTGFNIPFLQNNAADFPYTYTGATVLSPANHNPQLFTQAEVNLAFQNITPDGRITFYTLPGQTGFRDFSYNVVDRRGNSRTMTVRVRIVNQIPSRGLYDNTSFIFSYRGSNNLEPGGWLPISLNTAINNTLHTTSTVGDYATATFRGTGFVLYLNNIPPSLTNAATTFELTLRQGPTPFTTAGWTAVPGSNNAVFEADFVAGPVTAKCSTRARRATTSAVFLTSVAAGNLTIACEFSGTTASVYTLTVTNRALRSNLRLDALSILDRTSETSPADEPLLPGYYDVDQLAVRGIFNADWQQLALSQLSSGLGYAARSAAPAAVTFAFTGARGFALGTTLEAINVSYDVCVRDLANNETCQRFTNAPKTPTAATFNVFRPFYGYDPTEIYIVSIENISVATNGRFIIDSITILPETLVTDGPLPFGSTEDDRLERFVFGGGLEDNWQLSTIATGASNNTLTSIAAGVTAAGPFMAFSIPATADTLYWNYRFVPNASTRWMFCVDRALGSASPLERYGNCIVVNTRPVVGGVGADGVAFQVVNRQTGALTNGTGSLQPTPGHLVLRESLFPGGTWGPGSGGVHIIEAFSLANEPFSLDRVIVQDSTQPLVNGLYEEFATGITYWERTSAAGITPQVFAQRQPQPSSNITLFPADFNLATGANARFDSGGGVVYTGDIGNVVYFTFTGTGFEPRFRLSLQSDAVRICWRSGAPLGNPSDEINAVLAGTCIVTDNQFSREIPRAGRTIAGLPNDTYRVVIQMLEDNNVPAPHSGLGLPLHMIFDSVVIYDNPLPAGALAGSGRTETSFNNRLVDGRFSYFGSGWQTINAAAASGGAYDLLPGVNLVGAGVLFRIDATTTQHNVLTLYRDVLPTYADYDLCWFNTLTPTERECRRVPNTFNTRSQLPIVFYLNDTPQAAQYVVSIIAAAPGAVFLDALETSASGPLTAGIYNELHPAIAYNNRPAANLAVNGTMEVNAGWSVVGTVTGNTLATPAYSGITARRVTTGGAGGIQSQPFAVESGQTYTVVARVLIRQTYTGTLTMQLYNGGTPLLPAASLDTATMPVNTWQVLRLDYTAAADLNDVRLRFESSAATAQGFQVDDVIVQAGGTWETLIAGAYTGTTLARSRTHGGQINFSFTGTGFSLTTLMNRSAGEMQVCYGVAVATENCFVYENETTAATGIILRSVVGLPLNTYRVRIRDAEDGYVDDPVLVTNTSNALTRPASNQVGSIALDQVQIYNLALPPRIDDAVQANDDYRIGGTLALQLLPAERWQAFTGAFAASRSGQSVFTAITPATRTQALLDAGQTVTLNLGLTTNGDEATVIVNTGSPFSSNSVQLLACVDAVNGSVDYDSTLRRYVLSNSTTCTLNTTLRQSPQAVFNSDTLPGLAVTGSDPDGRVLTLRTLSPGTLSVDDYQVIYGTALPPGAYEDVIGTRLLRRISGTWATLASPLYSANSALQGTDTFILEFDIVNSTGFSLLTPQEPERLGAGNLSIQVTGQQAGINDNFDQTFIRSTILPAVVQRVPTSITGLPVGNYRVRIQGTGAAGSATRFTLDGLQVYGEAGQLGSLYDDDARDLNNNKLITYGPAGTAWTQVATDITALNRTTHTTRTRGGVAFFEVGAATPAIGIRLFYGRLTSTDLQVCWQRLPVDNANNANNQQTCTTATLNGAADTSSVFNAPDGPDGDTAPDPGYYSVSVINNRNAGVLVLDAVQVLETTLAEGIHDALYLRNTQPTIFQPLAAWSTPTGANNRTIGTPAAFIELTFRGVGFSLLLNESATSASQYGLCVDAPGGGTCDTIGTAGSPLTLIRGAAGNNALTYVGLPDATYTLRLTNTGTGSLTFLSIHILGSKPPAFRLTTTDLVENADERLRYLPFGSVTETINKSGRASAFSEHFTTTAGAGVYFTFQGEGFEYGRSTARNYGAVDICYGLLNVPSHTPTQCVSNVSNSDLTVPQRAFAVTTPACTGQPCWATIRSRSALTTPFDFIRLYDPDSPLVAGLFEENHPSIRSFRETTPGTYSTAVTPADFNFLTVLQPSSSGGQVLRYVGTTSGARASAINGGMFFRITGTGFTVNFIRDTFADTVKICTLLNGTSIATILNTGDCQVFDNYNATIQYRQGRSVLGLPPGTYGVVVQMLPDDNLPRAHSATELPLSMQIDSLRIYDEDWTSLNPLVPGTRYESSVTSAAAENRYQYYGAWTSLTGPLGLPNSGGAADRLIETGGGVVFRTSGANALVLTTSLSTLAGQIQLCARALDAGLEQERAPVCEPATTTGSGAQQPITLRFDPADTGDYVVWVTTLNEFPFILDTLEVTSTILPLPAGLHEATDPRIVYNTDYTNRIINGNQVTNTDWSAVGPATFSLSITAYEGTTSRQVNTTALNQGIRSLPFSLTAGTDYVLMARVYVISGEVRVRVVNDSGTPVGMDDFIVTPRLQWYPVRRDFTATASGNYRLQFLANNRPARFLIDAISLVPSGEGIWQRLTSRSYSAGNLVRSTTPGATASFDFTGTGFELSTPGDSRRGEFEVCYGLAAGFPAGASCFVYQQEGQPAAGLSRLVTGLAPATYRVRLRDVEDGLLVSSPRAPAQGLTAGIFLDFVRIFNDAAPQAIADGTFGEEERGSNGQPLLQALPAERWRSQLATVPGYTNNTFLAVVGAGNVPTNTLVGNNLNLTVIVPANSQSTVILFGGPRFTGQTRSLLVCAGASSGATAPDYNGVRLSGRMTWNGTTYGLANSTTCTLKNMALAPVVTISATELPALNNPTGAPVTVNVMATSLSAGGINIDGFRVIEGTTLGTGLFDDALADNLMNFNNAAGTGAASVTTPCDLNAGWCQTQAARTVGGSITSTRQFGATLNFRFEGTGFSVVTSPNTLGTTMRICYKPATSSESFPATNANLSYPGRPAGLKEVWCDRVTTSTLTTGDGWSLINRGRINPVSATQYGFAYYGLQFNTYVAEVRMIDNALALRDSLQIDAINVFGDVPPLLTAGLYDNASPAIVYEPAALWRVVTPANVRSGPPSGPLNRTENIATAAGTVSRVQTSGNAFTLFQTTGASGSRDLRICLVISDDVLPCVPESEPGLTVQMTNFSQSGTAGFAVPVIFYGLGQGSHHIIIENRDHQRNFSVDAIRVLP